MWQRMVLGLVVLAGAGPTESGPVKPPVLSVQGVGAAAARYGARYDPLQPARGVPLLLEAEEFHSEDGAWQARDYGTNYYVSTFANTFLSRWGYLAAARGASGVARRRVLLPEAGNYLVLVRYEAVFRHHTPFAVRIHQGGRVVFQRLYGRRDRPRIWAFGRRLAADVSWPWGANEQIVWEGHDAVAELAQGEAVIELVALEGPTPMADRHIDCLLLTTDHDEVRQRIQHERYLPLDGLLTQQGDLWCQVTNHSIAPLQVTLPPCIEHSPYWVHLRRWRARSLVLQPGERSEWLEVGGLLDTLNHSVWMPKFRSINGPRDYTVRLAVRDPQGELQVIYDERSNEQELRLYMSPAVRYVPLVYRSDRVLAPLLRFLEERLKRAAPGGVPPKRFPLYALSFAPLKGRTEYNRLVDRWYRLFPLWPVSLVQPGTAQQPRGYVDVRHIPTQRLAAFCERLRAEGLADRVLVVSLGDEIALPAPRDDQDEAFRAWLRQQGLRPGDVVPTAQSWQQVRFAPPPDPEREPRRYYYVQRYRHQFGIRTIKQRTDILRRHLPNAWIGANYSPHQGYHYLGEVHKWVEVFQQEAMTLPWSEDYIWQIPVVSPQVNSLGLDLFRAALRGKRSRQIMYYVLPHWPGNAPGMWRRLFFASLGHGMTMCNLFEFRPLAVAYTENYVNHPETYWQVLRAFRELARFEDILLDGRIPLGNVGLWFSHVADVWHDYEPPFAAEKRSLYVVLRYLQAPVEVVTEHDVRAKRLDAFRVLFVVDRHLERRMAEALYHWVRRGGRLYLSAGAATRDQFDRPLQTLYRPLGGVPQLEVEQRVPIRFVKQDLAYAPPIGRVRVEATGEVTEAYGARAVLGSCEGLDIRARFDNGSPALVRAAVGEGEIWYCAFLPALSAVRPSVRREPVTRGGDESRLSHRCPTRYQPAALAAVHAALRDLKPAVDVKPGYVEGCLVQSAKGAVLILVAWSQQPTRVRVALRAEVPQRTIITASGKPLRVTRDGEHLVLELSVDAAEAVIFR